MGVGGQGCEDVGNMGSLGRVGNSIQVMDHWTRGEGSVEGRTVGKGRDRPQKRGASTLYSTLQTYIHHSLNQHVMSIYQLSWTLGTQNVVRYSMVPWAILQRLILPAPQKAGIDTPICPKYK